MLSIVQVAELVHEANRIYCRMHGDDSQLPWGETSDMIRDSTIAGVKTHVLHPYLTPQQSHESWVDYKRKEGWVWGPVKDITARTHPCLMPYNQLPEEQKVKDWIFKGIVNAIMAEGQIDFAGML